VGEGGGGAARWEWAGAGQLVDEGARRAGSGQGQGLAQLRMASSAYQGRCGSTMLLGKRGAHMPSPTCSASPNLMPAVVTEAVAATASVVFPFHFHTRAYLDAQLDVVGEDEWPEAEAVRADGGEEDSGHLGGVGRSSRHT